MKGKIDKRGYLFIGRAGQMSTQYCPFVAEERNCGDWCPQFGEPNITITGAWIEICTNRQLCFKDFTDERV